MPLSIDSVLGVHAEALKLRSQRTELLASNMANADTPNYKAKDIDFRATLDQAQGSAIRMKTTQANHMQSQAMQSEANVRFRIPSQPSLDGNTVDVQMEKAKFAENAMQYQATLRFLNGKISAMRTAIKGE